MADQFRQIAPGPLNVVVHLLFVCVVCPSRLDGAEVRMQASHMISRKDIWKNHVTLYFKVLDALAQRKRSPVSVDNSISQNVILPRGKSCVTTYIWWFSISICGTERGNEAIESLKHATNRTPFS